MEIVITKEVELFIASLEKPTIAKILRTIDLLEQFVNKLRLPHSKSLGKGLFELRIHCHKKIRLFYVYHKKKIVILYCFIKKSRQIPKNEINIAYCKLRELNRPNSY